MRAGLINSPSVVQIANLKPVVASAAVLDIFTKSGGAVPDATHPIYVAIPDANGLTLRNRIGAVASGTSIITLADAANYWLKGSLDEEIKTAWVYAIWSEADQGIVWALGGYSGFTIVPTTTTETDDDYFLLEGSSTYTRAATDYCVAVCKIRYEYDTADVPDHTLQATVLNAPQVIWNPKSDYGYQKNLATSNVAGANIADYSAISVVAKQSGKYSISIHAVGSVSAGTYEQLQCRIKTGSATYGTANQKAFMPTSLININQYISISGTVECYVNAGDTIHCGAYMGGDGGNRSIFGDNQTAGMTFLSFIRID